MTGLLISDSLMKFCPEEAQAKLMNSYDLRELDVKVYPGKTTRELIGVEGEVHSLLRAKQYDRVFLVSGANCFNRNSDDCPFRKCRTVADQIKDLIHSFCQQYPNVELVFAPIPHRQVCQVPSVVERFPESGSQAWIDTTNEAISHFQSYFSVCSCHAHRARFIVSPDLSTWVKLLSKDGLHLTDFGKSQMIEFFISSKSRFSFNDQEFPPLPKHSGTFSFEPKVSVPRRMPIKKPVENHNLFIHQCCLAQDISFRGPQILGQNFNITTSPKVNCATALSHKKEKEKASKR